MTIRVSNGQGTQLGLPGRSALEIASGTAGSVSMTFRKVEIPVPTPGEPLRKPHVHVDFEECIHVLEGTGVTCTESGDFEVGSGDTMIITAGELHVTRNTGDQPLILLCFFPVPDIVPGTNTGTFPDKNSQRPA